MEEIELIILCNILRPVGLLAFCGALALPLTATAQGVSLDKGDKYVACVIGRAIIFVQRGMAVDTAQNAAYKSCGEAPASLSTGDDGGEGFRDFINLAVMRFAGE